MTRVGTATDGSNGSNKRVRHADSATVVNVRGAPTSILIRTMTPITPMKRADTPIDRVIALLHNEVHVYLKKFAHDLIMAFATHFCAREKFQKEDKNDDYFPSDCKISMQLQTSKAIGKGPGFKDLAQETEEIVIQCRKMLKKQHMKCVETNVIELKRDITRKYAIALPKVAMLLLALELEVIEIVSVI